MLGFVIEFGKWGPAYWYMAHSVTWRYPDTPTEEEKRRMISFFSLLPYLLPCAACTMHFIETVRDQYPLTDDVLKSRDTLTRWLVNVHNSVNRRLHKPEVDYAEVRRFYVEDCSIPIAPIGTDLKTSQAENVSDPKDDTEPYKIAVGVLAGLLVLVLIGLGIVMFRLRQRHNQSSTDRSEWPMTTSM